MVDTATSRRGRRPAGQEPQLWTVPVLRVDPLAPTMLRVTAGGPGLGGFLGTGTDQHVKLYCYEEGAEPPRPLTMRSVRAEMHRVRPAIRSYSIRRYDPGAREIDVDFVLHDEPGPVSEWASRVEPGDELIFAGPSPAYEPAPDVAHYLLAGDSSALPAIEATLLELPEGTTATVLAELTDAAEERELATPAELRVRWLAAGELTGALRTAVPAKGSVDAWIAGERDLVRACRAHLLDELHLDRRYVRPTTYWRKGHAGT
jgi:NADPH-dependent ferric siderophore reductase